MKAILLHHAGGDKYAFRNVQQWLLPEIDSIAVELPGRSDRFNEVLLTDIHTMTEDIFQQLKNELNENYFFIGVSMGSLIAYLLTHKIKEENLPLPKYLFLASRLSPDAYTDMHSTKDLTSEDFWKTVIQYDGVPEALLEHEELRNFYEPILRADFNAIELYNTSHKPKEKLIVSASVFIGNEDVKNVTMEKSKDWNEHFINDIFFKEFDGGHFFIYDNEKATEFIKATILSR